MTEDRFVQEVLDENARRNAEISAKFDPISGKGSVGERTRVNVGDFPIKVQYLPVEMMHIPLVRQLVEYGSVQAWLVSTREEDVEKNGERFNEEEYLDSEEYIEDRQKFIRQFVRLRCRYDFAFWAAFYVYIKNKGGGEDVLFRLTRPQRRFVERLEKLRKAGKPIRIILLKARQWGGSTTSQIYMAWLQLIHKVGLNSLIIAHQGSASDEIKDMFDRMIKAYPVEMLHKLGDEYTENEPKLVGVGKSGSIHRVPQRNCKIKIGSAQRPDGCRGGDYNLVHLSEVGLWEVTDGKKPEDIVQSACSGVLLRPYTMIVYESTAKGTGNFFHKEYVAAKNGTSQFEAMFVSWFDIEQYSLPFVNSKELNRFALWLYVNREDENVNSTREESGRYLWGLWKKGATLEAIHWYVEERKKYNDHGLMASEFPSDDVEAFVHSGTMVFDRDIIESVVKKTCKPPKYRGEVHAFGSKGKDALKQLRFSQDSQGNLSVWDMPEPDTETELVTNRYLTVVDVGGYTERSDYSVITVFDRLFMIDGGKPMVCAQWYGHCDIDFLGWRAAQIAALYNNALLVIEKNTVDKHDHERQRIDDNYEFLLIQLKDVYPNLYARKQSPDEIREGLPRKYGFHTNVSTKPLIIENLKSVIRDNLYIERDEKAAEEYLVYERKQNGSYGNVAGYHDDLVMTRAIGLYICFHEMDRPQIVSRKNRNMVKKNKVVSAATI